MRTGSDPRKAIASVLIALIVLSCAPLAFPSSHCPAGSDQSSKRFGSEYASRFAVDRSSVTLPANGYHHLIEVRSGTLISKDIDGDGDLDLVWIVANRQRSAIVLINDGTDDFTEAKDNAPYAAAIEALLGGDDPGEQPSLQPGNRTYSLFSSPGSDIAAAVSIRFAPPTIHSDPFTGFDRVPYQATFLSDLRQRGPPFFLS